MIRTNLEQNRYLLKDTVRQIIDFRQTGQNRGIPPPPIEKPFDPDTKRISLVPVNQVEKIGNIKLSEAIYRRKSHRRFTAECLTLEELSYLLYTTQGIKKQVSEGIALRTVPSAGARHALETYLCILNVESLNQGIYRYLPLEHQLLPEFDIEQPEISISRAVLGQEFVARAAVVFIWTTIPYRMEWRYNLAAHKAILLDAGHVCQNLYLAVEDIGAGTCAVAAYDQEAIDKLLRLNTEEEFVIYLAPVGKV